MNQINFQNPVHVHFIGIGGISMSGLAAILLKEGFTVSGSDAKESSLTDWLAGLGASIYYGQSASNIHDDVNVVVYTAAIHPDNPEYAAAVRKGIPMLTRAQLLDEVWGFDYAGDTRTVDVHIKRLREKLDGVSDKWAISTKWGVGYKFETFDKD